RQIQTGRQPERYRLGVRILMNGYRGFMSVCDGPDDVLRAPGRVAAEEDAGAGGHEGGLVYDREVLLAELDADVPLDPGKGRLLTYGQDHVIARENDGIDRLRMSSVGVPLQPLEFHSDQFPVFQHEALRGMVDEDFDPFLFGIFQLPGRGFE